MQVYIGSGVEKRLLLGHHEEVTLYSRHKEGNPTTWNIHGVGCLTRPLLCCTGVSDPVGSILSKVDQERALYTELTGLDRTFFRSVGPRWSVLSGVPLSSP